MKPRIHLVTDKPPATTPKIQLAGKEPTAEMTPGEYLAQCMEVIWQQYKNRIALHFVILKGDHAGVALSQWIPGVGTKSSPRSRYARECQAAMGRQLTTHDDLDPVSVFKDKIFWVKVGYRLSDNAGGGRSSDGNAMISKDRDFLRVLQILRPGEL